MFPKSTVEYCPQRHEEEPPQHQTFFILFITDPLLSAKLPSGHRSAVVDLESFYKYFRCLSSEELAAIISPLPAPLRQVRRSNVPLRSFLYSEHTLYSGICLREYLIPIKLDLTLVNTPTVLLTN